jgi:broad specificity phosphatase PhoE
VTGERSVRCGVSEQLILVRHGETVHNVAGIAQGWNDSALSDRGRRQVARLAERVAAMGVDTIYSSSLNRAFETARAIGQAADLGITTLDDLREMNYGGWEGRSFLDVRRDDVEVYRSWIADPDAASPNGESHNDVRARLERAFAGMSGRRVVVVTHGTAIRIAATALMQLPTLAAARFAQQNAAINIFVRRDDHFVLKLWNDTTHCGD